jgi:hypothetical protein
MPTTRAATLLHMWEQASHCEPQARALRLLAWALPGHDVDQLSELDVGERDWYLLQLRRRLFGTRVSAHGQCAHCGTEVEVEFDASQVQGDLPLPPAPFYVDGEGRRFRLPRCGDLVAITGSPDADSAECELFRRCAIVPEHAQAADFDEIDRGLGGLAAQRQLHIELACDTCRGKWTLAFDPGAFLWEEIQAQARTLLDDVHRLASAYGWSERAVLAMNEARRAAYLERLQ